MYEREMHRVLRTFSTLPLHNYCKRPLARALIYEWSLDISVYHIICCCSCSLLQCFLYGFFTIIFVSHWYFLICFTAKGLLKITSTHHPPHISDLTCWMLIHYLELLLTSLVKERMWQCMFPLGSLIFQIYHSPKFDWPCESRVPFLLTMWIKDKGEKGDVWDGQSSFWSLNKKWKRTL